MLFRAERVLDASPEEVWAVLTDFAAYPEWNPFTPEVAMGRFEVGAKVSMLVRLAGRSQRQKAKLTELVPGQRFAWEVRQPLGVVKARREQRVEPVKGGKARYVSEDDMSGLMVGLVDRLYGDALRMGFDEMLDALEERVAERKG